MTRLTHFGCDVIDHGDVEFDETLINNDVEGNVKNPRAVAAVSRKVGPTVIISIPAGT